VLYFSNIFLVDQKDPFCYNISIVSKKEFEMTIRNEYLWLVLLVAIIISGPLLGIWALNTLFPALAIPYNIETWFAVVLLSGLSKTTINRG
jgi:hypothetical protein